jgi:hypothetical protein
LSWGLAIYAMACVFTAAIVRGYSGFGFSLLAITSLSLRFSRNQFDRQFRGDSRASRWQQDVLHPQREYEAKIVDNRCSRTEAESAFIEPSLEMRDE